jgi:hypothetical protein
MLWTCEVGVRISVLTILAFVVAAFPILALSKNSTDAARDGLKGAVKSVSTERQIVSPPPSQPDGPTIIYPIWCEVCEYDRDGNVVRRGQNWETGFVGETARYVRDEDGTVRQEIVENEKGELDRTVIIGRFGKTEEEFYQHGVLQSRNKYLYDQNGNIIEWLTHDAHGVETARTVASFDEQGTITEQFDYGPNNRFLLHYTQTYDREVDVQTFTNFNEDGTVRLRFIAQGNRVASYWQQPSDVHELGSTVCFTTGCESRNPDGSMFRTVTTFADGERRNPIRAELRDAADQAQMAAEYEYESDGHGNWTKRSVWIWTPESGERILNEIDSRVLTYWK